MCVFWSSGSIEPLSFFGLIEIRSYIYRKLKHMSKVQIKSIFEQIAENVFKMSDVNQAKTCVKEFVESKKIKAEDKVTIISNVEACKSISRVHTYICNSLLKYEGMGLG